MNTITLHAHFDGQQIQLDEPFELKPNAKLIVMVVSDETIDEEREDWRLLAHKSLDRVYGEDEPEYPLDMIKELNPNYEKR